MLACMGPFEEWEPRPNRAVFRCSSPALVPKDEVALDYARLYSIMKAAGGFYVVYETENVDFYRPYLAPLPAAAEVEGEVWLPRCPRCKSWRCEIEEDEMYCYVCDGAVPIHTEKVWEPRPFNPGEVLQGAGIFYLLREGMTDPKKLRVVRRLGERNEVLGNVEVKVERVVGYHFWYVYDDYRPFVGGFGTYDIFRAFGKEWAVRVGSMEKEDLLNVARTAKENAVIEAVLQTLPRGEAVALVKELRLWEEWRWRRLREFADEEVRELRLKLLLSKLREAWDDMPLLRLAVEELEEIGYKGPELEEARARIEELRKREEEWRKSEEERKRKEMEEEEKLERFIAELKKELEGLPVQIAREGRRVTVSLTRRVPEQDFKRYVSTLKARGFRWNGKAWTRAL